MGHDAGGSERGPIAAPAEGARPTEDRLHVEDLADKLLDKREKFAYFLITAMAFIVAFTFGDFSDRNGVLHHAPVGLVAIGYVVLVLSSIFSLYVIRARHETYTQNLRILESGRVRADPVEAERFRRSGGRIQGAERLSSLLFGAGIVLIAAAYVVGMLKI
jgi:hypothetical protein